MPKSKLVSDAVVSRMAIFKQINSEREYQSSRFDAHFDDKNTANDWAAYINKYVGNSTFANQYGQPFDSVEWRKQMVKVATLAVAALEAFDRNGCLPPRHYDVLKAEEAK